MWKVKVLSKLKVKEMNRKNTVWRNFLDISIFLPLSGNRHHQADETGVLERVKAAKSQPVLMEYR